jgi:hypothetical protein
MANDYLEQGGGAGGWDVNVEGAGNNDGKACVSDEDDDDDLDKMHRSLRLEILLKSLKAGSRKFGKGDKSIEGDYV